MPYVAGYFGKGKRIYPGSLDSSNQKRRRLEALEDVALSAGQPELAGAIDEVGDILFGEDNQDLQVVPQAQSAALLPGSSRGRSVARRTGMARRRGRKWSFDRRVRRIMLNMVETKKHNEAHVANVFEAGDGTTVVTHIRNYVQQIGQGSEGQDIEGNEIYIRGFRWIGRFTNNETFDMYVRVWVIWSPFFADLANDWQTYGNTTTASANPTQTATDFEFNIPQYDAGTTSQQFTGAVGGADTIDTDVAKVVWSRVFHLKAQHNPTQSFKVWIPINRMWKHATASDVAPTDELRNFRFGNYYHCIKVWTDSSANDILATSTVTADFEHFVYFKDP